MKTPLLIVLFISSFFFLSCTADEAATTADPAKEFTYTTYSTGVSPQNTANVYDYAGEQHNQILENALLANPTTLLSSVILATDTAALANSAFVAIAPLYTGLNTTTVQWVATNSNNAQLIVNNSGAAAAGRTQLMVFLSLLTTIENYTYNDQYNAIATFEYKIINSPTLTTNDKAIILTTTSIARWAYFYKDDKDKDWGGLRNGVYGSIKGRAQNLPMAITMAVACGIDQDN